MLKTRNKEVIFLVLGLIIIGGVIFFITNSSDGEGNIKVGAMLVLSGEGAPWGEASHRAIEMAVNEANAAGGINGKQIELLYEDTEGNTAKAVSAYNKLVDVDGVVAILGPNFQTEMAAISPLANEDDFPIITPSYAPFENRPNPKNPLMIWLDPTIQSEQMADYVYNKGVRTVSVVGTVDSWEKEVSNAFARRFEELGGEIKFIDLVQTDADEVKTVAARAVQNDPEAVYIGTYYQFLNFGRAFKELGYGGQLYSIEVDEYLAGESKDFMSGLEFISSETYKEEFREKYEFAYGEKSNIPSGQSYDAANILISFLRQTTDRTEIVGLMEEFDSYDGVSGKIRVVDNRTIIPTAIYTLDNGEIVEIQSLD